MQDERKVEAILLIGLTAIVLVSLVIGAAMSAHDKVATAAFTIAGAAAGSLSTLALREKK